MIKVYNEVARYVNQCFDPNTLLYTDKGIKKIIDITYEDKLVTNDGSCKKINQIIVNKIDKEILEITTSNSIFPVKVTKEHDIYVIKNIDKLSIIGIYDKLEMNTINPEFICAKDLTIDDLVCYPIPLYEQDSDKYDIEFCKYYGILLNSKFEYCVYNESSYENSISIYNNNNNNNNYIIKYLKNNNIKYIEKDDIITWIDFKVSLDFISNEILNLPINKISVILDNINYRNISINTTSYNLYMQIKYMYLRNGVVLNCDEYLKWNNQIWCTIRSIKNINYIGEVYDFNIIDNHNYLTDIGLVHNSGKRKGSIAIYLEPWHADIEAFIDLKKNTGAETERARDIFTALWIPDIFMEKVIKNEDWYLMCPSECPNLTEKYGDDFNILYNKYITENKYKKKINSQDLFNKIMDSQIESGVPYILYKDNINRKNNQSNIGIIKSSNLCVHGKTQILTKQGYQEIISLKNKDIEIWNGIEWSSVNIIQTGFNINLLRIHCSNGSFLDCTSEHKFYISETEYKMACEINIGDILIDYKLPEVIEIDNNNFKYPYTHGYLCGNEYIDNLHLLLYDDKKKLLEFMDYYSYTIDDQSIDIILNNDICVVKVVPSKYSSNIRLRWLEGIFDSNGYYCNYKKILYLIDQTKLFLIEIRYMLHTLGIESDITIDTVERYLLGKRQIYYKLVIDALNINKLLNLKFMPKYINIDIESINDTYIKKKVYITHITESYKKSDTYCFTEHKRNMGMFNGILTGQCAEIVEVSNTHEYSVCNLGSIAVNRFIKLDKIDIFKKYNLTNNDNLLEQFKMIYDFDKLLEISKILTYNLNLIIDYNFYPVKETYVSNMNNRPIGIGIQGLGDLYYILELPYNSYAAKYIDSLIMETIYFGSIYQSSEIAKQVGSYPRFDNSPFSKGLFQFDLVKKENKFDFSIYPQMHDWNMLKDKVINDGMRNSLLTALMPTASSSQIRNNNECFEPYSSNIFKRTTLAGEFQVVNRYLIQKLIVLNKWNDENRNNIIVNDGSVKELDIDDKLKEVFKTIWEIKQKDIIDHALARSPYVDQSQSMNLFFADPNYKKLFSALVYGWEKGIKTGCYYLRSKPAVEARKIAYECTVCSS